MSAQQTVAEVCQGCFREIGQEETPCVSDGKVLCTACWSIRNNAPAPVPIAVPPRIAGWLLLPALHVIIGPLLWFGSAIEAMKVDESVRSQYGNASSVNALVGFVFVSSVFVGLLQVVCAIAFFKKLRASRPLMIVMYSVVIAVNVIFEVWANSVFQSQTDSSSIRGIMFASGWLVYFLMSKRVKATFIR